MKIVILECLYFYPQEKTQYDYRVYQPCRLILLAKKGPVRESKFRSVKQYFQASVKQPRKLGMLGIYNLELREPRPRYRVLRGHNDHLVVRYICS